MKSKNGLSARLTAPTLRVEYIITQAIDIPPGLPGGERSSMSEKDTAKRKYEQMEIQSRKKPRVWALHIAGYSSAEIAKRLFLAPTLVELWVRQLGEAVRSAEMEVEK